MTITIEVTPEVEAELAAQAAARGMDVQAYAATLLEDAAKPRPPEANEQSLSEFFLSSPLAGSGITLDRDKDPGRSIQL